MNISRSLRRMCHAAGRLLDFGGSYNAALWQVRLETPGWLRDRQAFSIDATMLTGDMRKAAQRMEAYYGKQTR